MPRPLVLCSLCAILPVQSAMMMMMISMMLAHVPIRTNSVRNEVGCHLRRAPAASADHAYVHISAAYPQCGFRFPVDGAHVHVVDPSTLDSLQLLALPLQPRISASRGTNRTSTSTRSRFAARAVKMRGLGVGVGVGVGTGRSACHCDCD